MGTHQVDEIVEEVDGVVRAGSSIGVVLHRERAGASVAHTLDGLVVDLDVGDLQIGARQRLGVDGVPVILAGELDASGAQVAYRVVEPAMAEPQFVGVGPIGQAEQLMSHANTEDGVFLLEIPDDVDRLGNALGVAGAVGQHDPVG